MSKARFSKIGFILAAVGSAVGLGNIWKFPYVTGEYGGGAFVLVYLVVALFIGVFMLIAEMLIGKTGKDDAVSMYEKLATKGSKYWKFAGFAVFISLTILSYYSVIIGWIFHYIALCFQGLPENIEDSKNIFVNLVTSDVKTQLLYHTIVFVLVFGIVSLGIKKGIEKINEILMPLLAIILIGLFVYSTTLGGFKDAIAFMFNPDFSKLSTQAVLVATGQAFYTLSLGMGIIITYAASIPEGTNIVKSSITISIIDTLVAILAGVVIFSLLFDKGAESTKGVGLLFISLPSVFHEFGSVGQVLSILFFVAVAFAGVTSAVSMVEPSASYFISRFKLSRVKAVLICGLYFYLLGITALLSNISEYQDSLTIFGKNLFDFYDYTASTLLVPICGISTVIFVGFFMDKQVIRNELVPVIGLKLTKFWFFMIRYVIPIALTFVVLNETKLINF